MMLSNRSSSGKMEAAEQQTSNVTRRVLAIFINEGTAHALRVCQIADWVKADYQAVYSAVRRFCKHGIVKSVRRMIGKKVLSFYILNDKDAALEYMGYSDLAFLGVVPRSGSAFVDWVDLGRAVYECGVIVCYTDISTWVKGHG